MAQGGRRAKAVLAAAVAWREKWREVISTLPSINTAGVVADLVEAVDRYKEVMAVQLPADPSTAGDFVCPHCGTVKPAYGWNYNAGDTGPFALAYVTCFCGSCKGILSVSVTTFTPTKELAEALAAQFRSRLATPV